LPSTFETSHRPFVPLIVAFDDPVIVMSTCTGVEPFAEAEPGGAEPLGDDERVVVVLAVPVLFDPLLPHAATVITATATPTLAPHRILVLLVDRKPTVNNRGKRAVNAGARAPGRQHQARWLLEAGDHCP
jgi:hypothetical protein